MSRITLTVAAAAVAIGSFPTAGHCDLPTIDFANLSQNIKSYALGLKQEVLQIQGVQTALDTFHEAQGILHDTTGTLNEVTSLYSSVSGVRSIGQGISVALGQVGMQDPLPFSVGSIEGLMNQRNPIGLLNTLGALGGAYSANTSKNTIWHPTDPNSDGAQAMTSRIGVVSASQATAETLFTDSQNRLPNIRALTDQINNAPDQATRESLMVRLQGEIALNGSTNNEAIAASMLSQTSLAAEDLRAQQRQQQSLHEFNAEATLVATGQ